MMCCIVDDNYEENVQYDISDEEYAVKQAYLRDLWENRENEDCFITDDMEDLEIEKRKKVLDMINVNNDDDEIEEIEINNKIYCTNGKFVVEINDNELGKIVGYIENIDEEITESNVIFFK